MFWECIRLNSDEMRPMDAGKGSHYIVYDDSACAYATGQLRLPAIDHTFRVSLSLLLFSLSVPLCPQVPKTQPRDNREEIYDVLFKPAGSILVNVESVVSEQKDLVPLQVHFSGFHLVSGQRVTGC